MEEQSNVQELHCHHHGEEKIHGRPQKTVKHEQNHCQYQRQETQTKKTGNGKLNCSTGERDKVVKLQDSSSLLSSGVGNGNTHRLDTTLKPKQTAPAVRVSSLLFKVGSKANCNRKNSMDRKNDKPSENNPRGGKAVDKKEAVSLLNGVVALNSGCITNGYPGKPAADNDGSGSETGYTTPKKRKARRNSAKGLENMTLPPDRTMQQQEQEEEEEEEQGDGLQTKRESELCKPECVEKADRWLEASGRAARAKPATAMAEIQRKNSDTKLAAAAAKKLEDRPNKTRPSVATKDDSWTLFKPPPVFPVDNSSAKIVPKISYASKVKENLNKAAGEAFLSHVPGKLAQVPMSAMKAVASAGFTNGPLSGDGPLLHFLSTAARTVTASFPGGGSVSLSPDSSSTPPSTATGEQKKPSLFIYPSNMQPVLPGVSPGDLPASAQTNQQNLGDIFQNQWGLSFINEPSAGPKARAGRSAAGSKAGEVTYQGECAAASVSQGAQLLLPSGPAFPKAYELEKRTNPQVISSVLKACPAAPGSAGGSSSLEAHGGLQRTIEAVNPGAIVFASSMDLGAESPQASPTNAMLALAKEQRYQRGSDRRGSWGAFDVKTAVIYHTKEMEFILNLQKQDPKRIITYDEALDLPDQ
ncbi:nuclear fragile X mental retardation-interacting protein 2-like [Acipenser oxyrinchus oxyrinchus]|uniref:Nuclear fragile X mental retardation-interacting protein 2-like n=1 Tax=Acipenser oxyrinchus oxyrinchus TaxID=40147 RepID=A0AAD8FY93_ACIOX|nr:nuclear fragile X mental retardation-interacting protein 2-like [Acipenser oxyrinchus oxyrinchus]